MSKEKSTPHGQPSAAKLATQKAHAEQRRRLAENIGRLLADTWLRRRREAETSETRGGDVSPEDRVN